MSQPASPAPNVMVVFTPSGKRGRFAHGTPVLEAARALGVDLDSVCGGRGLCGRCQIRCMEGEFSKHRIHSSKDSLSGVTSVEKRYEKVNRVTLDDKRLSCQTKLLNDVVIDIPPESQVHRQVVRKGADYLDIELESPISLHFVHVQEPDMHDPTSDLRRLLMALEYEWRLENLQVKQSLLSSLQTTLRKGSWQVTVAVNQGREVIAVWPGFVERIYGLAVDVGSTTIAAHLSDMSTGEVKSSAGIMNPQIRFGEDLMSRVSYVMMNPGGEQEMTKVVREALNTLITEVAAQSEVDPEHIVALTLVANPVMHHLMLGINPVELGGAPFALTTDQATELSGSDMDLCCHPNANIYVLPCIAGHVGADTAGVILSEQPQTFDEMTLLVDVGTNAEIVLGNRQRILACSSPTGPAFEGAQISGGQRAAPGAIERVRIDPETLEPRFRIIGSECWSDDPNFDAESAATGVTGICGSGIIEVVAEMYLAGIINQDGLFDNALTETNPRVFADGRTYSYLLHDGDVKIIITQNDIRQIQLAKAALYAGVRLLMDKLEVETVERIRLAGAFGSHIDVKYAMVLGLIPDCALESVASAGNAAGTGARIALLRLSARQEIEALVRQVEKIETAVEPKFQEHFVNAMAIPHKTDAFPELGKAVSFPPIKHIDSPDKATTRARRRRRK